MPAPKKSMKVASIPDKCFLQICVYDGTRNLFPSATSVLYRIISADQKQVFVGEKKSGSVSFSFPFHDNVLDDYTIIVFSDGYKQAGFTPVKLSPFAPTTVDAKGPASRTPDYSAWIGRISSTF